MEGQSRGPKVGRRGRHRVAMLEPVLLLLLHRCPDHGYALLRKLRQFGLEDVAPGVVYKALREMETREWVTSIWDKKQTQGPPRRVYHLSALGDEMLDRYTQNLQRTQDVISQILDGYGQHMEEGEGEYH